MGSYHIVLVDDHVMFRQGLKRILMERSDLEVVGEVDCGLELLKLLEKLVPDLIILDISMPNLRGLEAIHEIKMNHPDVKILVLTMHKDKEYLHQAVTAGAEGYLLKEDADAELFSAIDRVRRGRIYVSPKLSEELTEDWAKISRGDHKPSFEPEKLTTRERQVLKYGHFPFFRIEPLEFFCCFGCLRPGIPLPIASLIRKSSFKPPLSHLDRIFIF